MKIIIHSIEELLQLTELIRPQETVVLRHDYKGPEWLQDWVPDALHDKPRAQAAGASEPDGLPDDIDAPQAVVAQAAAEVESGPKDDVAEPWPERDADGAKYSTDWHSDPKKLTAKNVWRAKRGRDEAAYKAWLLEQAIEVAEEPIAADAEPVATETHALPQPDGDEPATAPAQPASAVDLQALVAASQEAAESASDDFRELLDAGRDFITTHGTAAFGALKAAVAPRGDGTGLSLPEMTDKSLRRLMLACIANYPDIKEV